MVKHTQKIRRLLPSNCFTVFDYLGLQLYQGETPAQVFYGEYSKIFKNTYPEEYLRWLLVKLYYDPVKHL